MMINKIKQILKDHSSKIDFNEEEHKYTYKNKPLTSVSETLKWFKEGLKNIPKPHLDNAIHRGNIIHAIMEKYLEEQLNGNKEYSIDDAVSENALYSPNWDTHIENAKLYIQTLRDEGYEILAVEQMFFDNSVGIAGTVDMVWIKPDDNNGNCSYCGRNVEENHFDCCAVAEPVDDKYHILISDWKTGNLRVSNYAQVGIYHYLLKKALKPLKKSYPEVGITIDTDLISLKDGERI